MAFDFGLIKEHPYATGAVVIVGGIVVFYLLSSGTSGSTPTMVAGSGTNSNDAAIAQTNAAAAVQTNAQQVQLQQNQLEAQVANTQTAAAIETNDTSTAAQLAATLAQIQASTAQNRDTLVAQTTDTANQYSYAENLQSMQDAVLEQQINSGVEENANNNATALAGEQLQTGVQIVGITSAAGVQTTALGDALTLATQQESDTQANNTFAIENAGNFGFDKGPAIIESVLNNPTATAAVQGSAASSIASTAANASIINTLLAGLTKVGGAVATGLLG